LTLTRDKIFGCCIWRKCFLCQLRLIVCRIQRCSYCSIDFQLRVRRWPNCGRAAITIRSSETIKRRILWGRIWNISKHIPCNIANIMDSLMDFMLKRHPMKELIMQLQLVKYMLLNVYIFLHYTFTRNTILERSLVLHS